MENENSNDNIHFSKDSSSQNISNLSQTQSPSQQTPIQQLDHPITTQSTHEIQSSQLQQKNQQNQLQFPSDSPPKQQTELQKIRNLQLSQKFDQPPQAIQSKHILQQPPIQSQQTFQSVQNSQQTPIMQQFYPQQYQPLFQNQTIQPQANQTMNFQYQPVQFSQQAQQQQETQSQIMQPFQYQQQMTMQQPQAFQQQQTPMMQTMQNQQQNQIDQSQVNQTENQMNTIQSQQSQEIKQPLQMQAYQSQMQQFHHIPLHLLSKRKRKMLIQQFYQQMSPIQSNYYNYQPYSSSCQQQMQPMYQQLNQDQVQAEQKNEDQSEEINSDNRLNQSDQNHQQNEIVIETENQENHTDNEKSEHNIENDNNQLYKEQEEKSENKNEKEQEQEEKSENKNEKEQEQEEKSENKNEKEQEEKSENENEKEQEQEEKSENKNEKEQEEKSENENGQEEKKSENEKDDTLENEESFKLIYTYQTFPQQKMFDQQYLMQQYYMQPNQLYSQQMQTQYFNQPMQPYYYYPNQMYQYYPYSNFYQNNFNASPNGQTNSTSQLELSSPQFLEKIISDDPTNERELSANYVFELFKEIDSYYNTLHNSPIICSHGIIEFNEDKLSFEKEIESKFINTIRLLTSKFDKLSIQSIDENIENISARKSGSITKRKCNSTIYDNQNSNENEKEISNFILKSKIDVTLYIKVAKIRHFHLNEKLLSFYLGEFIDDSTCSYKIENVEVSTFVSYNLKLNTNNNHLSIISSPNNTYFNTKNEFIVNQLAYVYFSKEQGKHILNFYGIEIETQFIFPAKSIYFYRESNTNKLYIRGDIRVKEYIINGLDEYIQNACEEMNQNTVNHPIEWNKEFDPDGEIKKKTISIVESNTYFYEEFEYNKSVITIWDNELVLGCNSSLIFWEIGNSNEENNKQSNLKIENILTITSLSILKHSSANSYLAVASDVYPIIFIFNKEHQNVSRLISHTMGITSLCSYNFHLFSGSFDQTARLWDLNKDMPTALYNIKSCQITTIETGTFCDQLFLFIGTNIHSVFVISCTYKKILYEITLNEKAVPVKIVFVSASNKDKGDFSKLMVISECENSALQSVFKTIQVQYFVFA